MQALKDISQMRDKLKPMLKHFILIFPVIDIDIKLEHAFDGVRVNGWMQLITIKDVADKIYEYINRFNESMNYLNKILPEIKATNAKLILLTMGNYETCPSCKGTKGKRTAVTSIEWSIGGRFNWIDCIKCSGRGIVERDG